MSEPRDLAFWQAKAAIARTFAKRPAPPPSGRTDTLCRVADRLFLSSCYVEQDKELLRKHGITHVLQVGATTSGVAGAFQQGGVNCRSKAAPQYINHKAKVCCSAAKLLRQTLVRVIPSVGILACDSSGKTGKQHDTGRKRFDHTLKTVKAELKSLSGGSN